METKPSEQTDVTPSGSQQDAEQQSQQSTSVCFYLFIYVYMQKLYLL